MKDKALPRCAPEAVGISSRQVKACLQALMHDKTTMNGFMAARYGKVFAQGWWAPYGPELVHSNHSMGKSYTATAVGIAQREGLLSLEEKMVDVFAGEIAQRGIEVDPLLKEITIENVLTMTNGMEENPSIEGDWIGNYFRAKMKYQPGTHFTYNTVGSCMLGALVEKRTGQHIKEYLTPRLFEKIGIDPQRFVWLRFPNGVNAEPGTFATTEDNLRLAQLYVNGGRWDGKEILEESFVKAALSVQVENPYAPEDKDGRCGYGYQLWACSIPGVYRFDGGQGQYGIMWPEKGLVVSLHEGAVVPGGPQKTLDVLYDTLFAHLEDSPLPEDPGAYQELLSYEKSLHMAADPAGAFAPCPALQGQWQVTQGDAEPWLAVAPPGGKNFFALFQDPTRASRWETFSLDFQPEGCTLTANGYAVFQGDWDGVLRRRQAETVFPDLGAYAATARFTPEGGLAFTIHWLNGWFVTELFFQPQEGGVQVTARKTRLNEDTPYLIATCVGEREKKP